MTASRDECQFEIYEVLNTGRGDDTQIKHSYQM